MGYLFRGPYNEGYSHNILGSIMGSPVKGNYHLTIRPPTHTRGFRC